MKREGVTAVLIFIWAMLFTEMVKAATLSEFMGGYDNNLIYYAAGFSIMGGFIRTIMSLQNDNRIVQEKVAEAVWDALKALIAGMFVFFLIQALRASGYLVPIEVRFGAVVAAGWSRMAAVDWVIGLLKSWVNKKAEQLSDAPPNKPKE